MLRLMYKKQSALIFLAIRSILCLELVQPTKLPNMTKIVDRDVKHQTNKFICWSWLFKPGPVTYIFFHA